MSKQAATLFAGVAVVVTLHASNAHASPFSPAAHITFLFLHVLGAIAFMGNLVVSAMWMSQAKKTRDARVLHFAAKSVVRADWLFTLPGILLILVPGLLMLGPFGGFPGPAWVELALTLFVISGIIWAAVLIPLQKRMVVITDEAVRTKAELDATFDSAIRRWMMWGGIATLLPFVSLIVMVFKPSLWR